ncbi:uncharacterized protein LOC122043985 [Zingiber officinale]|uniref:uncharacterized protein LOC122043985 n=1 Tax=Zingiber officinale TaxID=94328 RepID=UPI001C4A8D13|nr:uncharacterized protein LOC122043985 [Zingiber officinale]
MESLHTCCWIICVGICSGKQQLVSAFDGVLIACEKWETPTKRKVEADVKATQTLQCGLTKEKLNRIGPFNSAKELWEKLIELHKGTSDTKDGISKTKESRKKYQIEHESEGESDSKEDDEITAKLVKLPQKLYKKKKGFRKCKIKKVA